MFTIYKKEIEWGGRTLTLETGKIARQADGSVVATYGETVVMANVCFEKKPMLGADFFPLTVNYQEKFYAGGRIPGGFFKREGRPTEKETLTSRLIDRPVRPLFPKAFRHETQLTITVLSMDNENDADVIALVAGSAALTISGIPFLGPIGCARVGYTDGKYILNPTNLQREDSQMDLLVSGTEEGVMMVESEASGLSEKVMLDAVKFGHDAQQCVIKAIIELAEVAGKPGYVMPEAEDVSKLTADLEKAVGADIKKAYTIQEKQARRVRLEEIRNEATAKFAGDDAEMAEKVAKIVKSLEGTVLRKDVLKNKIRIDGRKPTDVRPIVCETDVLPRTHGSALFTRGETQALVITTLGTSRDEQLIDAVEGEYKDSFMLHYNFPSYSVGECRRSGGPGRREIGHGKLARRAVERMLPSSEDFPYTIRVVSEITESNGSSSMASVCGASMSLMAAGVPMPAPIAGIAMGLVKEGKDFVVLSDIMGDEDHLGDMDFKVAGTKDGLTALQMDIKITSITAEIMKVALEQAKEGRLHILGKMATAIEHSRGQVSNNAPAMESFPIPKEDIRTVIGSGGKTIRELTETTGCSIDINDEGVVTVASVSRKAVTECVGRIKGLVEKPEIGKLYTGPVTGTPEFGAFVRVLPQHEGLLHISEIADFRINNINDVVTEGNELTVKVVDVDDRGKIRLTIKGVDQSEEVTARIAALAENAPVAMAKSSDDGEGGEDGEKSRSRGPRSRGPRRARA